MGRYHEALYSVNLALKYDTANTKKVAVAEVWKKKIESKLENSE